MDKLLLFIDHFDGILEHASYFKDGLDLEYKW